MMKTTALVGTAMVLALSLAQVQAQNIPKVSAEVKGPAPAAVNGQAIVPPVTAPPVGPPQAAPPQATVPSIGVAPNARIEQNSNATVPGVQSNIGTGAGVATQGLSADVKARYRRHNGQWWYQMQNGSWMYHSNGQWMAFHPGTYTAPSATVAQPEYYGAANNGGYDSGYSNQNQGYYHHNQGYYQNGSGYGNGYYYSNPNYGYGYGNGYGNRGYGYRSGYRGYGNGYSGYGIGIRLW